MKCMQNDVLYQKHAFNMKSFTDIIPEYFQFCSKCLKNSEVMTPDINNYSSFAFWFFLVASLIGTPYYIKTQYNLKKNKKTFWPVFTIEILLHLYLTFYILHGIVNCSGWTAIFRSIIVNLVFLGLTNWLP